MPDNANIKNDNVLLEFIDVKKYFPITQGVFARTKGYIKAVDGISYDIRKGETFGLVGESGCGKSTTSKLVLLIEPITGGTILFGGKDNSKLSKIERQAYRESIQPVFQDPTGSLDPRCRVRTIIAEPLQVRKNMTKAQINARVLEVLEMSGLRSEHADLFPHQFSGGQRQRIAIARALSTEPKLIILDEPISSLDVSIRANMMNQLLDLQAKLGLSYMLIAHDLAVILHMSTRVAVMYVGKIVETGGSKELYEHTAHPYTKALFAAAFHSADEGALILPGEVASPYNAPPGCHFHPRCPNAMPECKTIEPLLKEIAPGHKAACHLFK
jgi:oligopeptide transport system ATP-binding protein